MNKIGYIQSMSESEKKSHFEEIVNLIDERTTTKYIPKDKLRVVEMIIPDIPTDLNISKQGIEDIMYSSIKEMNDLFKGKVSKNKLLKDLNYEKAFNSESSVRDNWLDFIDIIPEHLDQYEIEDELREIECDVAKEIYNKKVKVYTEIMARSNNHRFKIPIESNLYNLNGEFINQGRDLQLDIENVDLYDEGLDDYVGYNIWSTDCIGDEIAREFNRATIGYPEGRYNNTKELINKIIVIDDDKSMAVFFDNEKPHFELPKIKWSGRQECTRDYKVGTEFYKNLTDWVLNETP